MWWDKHYICDIILVLYRFVSAPGPGYLVQCEVSRCSLAACQILSTLLHLSQTAVVGRLEACIMATTIARNTSDSKPLVR